MPAASLTTAVWRKRSRSGTIGSGDNCVELAHVDTAVALRASKVAADAALVLGAQT